MKEESYILVPDQMPAGSHWMFTCGICGETNHLQAVSKKVTKVFGPCPHLRGDREELFYEGEYVGRPYNVKNVFGKIRVSES